MFCLNTVGNIPDRQNPEIRYNTRSIKDLTRINWTVKPVTIPILTYQCNCSSRSFCSADKQFSEIYKDFK